MNSVIFRTYVVFVRTNSVLLRTHPSIFRKNPVIFMTEPAIFERATGLVLTSVKEEKHIILPATAYCVVRWGKLRIYTLLNPPEMF